MESLDFLRLVKNFKQKKEIKQIRKMIIINVIKKDMPIGVFCDKYLICLLFFLLNDFVID